MQGVGYPLDIVVCSAFGADMYDCVYPTRTARFGTALVPEVYPFSKSIPFNLECVPIESYHIRTFFILSFLSFLYCEVASYSEQLFFFPLPLALAFVRCQLFLCFFFSP